MNRGIVSLLLLFTSATSFAKEDKAPFVRKPASAQDCLSANKMLAEGLLKNAAKRIGFEGANVSEVKLNWISAGGDRYVFTGSIYKTDYEIVVKTDSGCFPQEVELIDTARK